MTCKCRRCDWRRATGWALLVLDRDENGVMCAGPFDIMHFGEWVNYCPECGDRLMPGGEALDFSGQQDLLEKEMDELLKPTVKYAV